MKLSDVTTDYQPLNARYAYDKIRRTLGMTFDYPDQFIPLT